MTPTSSAAAFLEDPLLMAIETLPASKLLTQAQVCLLLECTPRWLEERRSRGAPPPYVQLGDRMVRYAVGPLREWLKHTIDQAPSSPTEQRKRVAEEALGFDEPILRGGRRKKLPTDTFGRFVALAQAADEWPFVVKAPYGRPIDFLSALTLDVTDENASMWLSLEAFADQFSRALLHEKAEQSAEGIDQTFSGRAFPPGGDERLLPPNQPPL
ncbi:hypothetical protein [Luteibacter sp. 3190]|uniref:helix-turn-helix transcriptional regulator n=1 Tax=Luteibacter sp. 3190 TaxID=2817736 RepID=UPI00285FCAF5|nr:hypothetical protein [Luteibacter sp. 3190]MDR6936650.1 putative DNA-binding transcriptional regulator AlpA [Luteibacter sp. 3190]